MMRTRVEELHLKLAAPVHHWRCAIDFCKEMYDREELFGARCKLSQWPISHHDSQDDSHKGIAILQSLSVVQHSEFYT